MKIHFLIVCLLLTGVTAFLLVFAESNLAANAVADQDKTKRPPAASPSPTVQPSAKTPSRLVIQPSFRISETPTLNADRRAGPADVAFNPDDNEYLVVWESNGLTEQQGVTDIYGRRLNAGTNERIGTDFRISNLTDGDKNHSSNTPRVVYNKTAHEYLVVWNGSGLFDSPDRFFEVYAQRLSRAGKSINNNVRISYTTDLGKVSTSVVRSSSQADVAWNSANNEYLVIWKGIGEPEDIVKMEIYGQRVKADGELLGKYFRISHTTDQGNNIHANAPAVAYNSRDNQYLVVWSGGFKNESQVEIWGMGLSAGGAGLGTANDFRISQATDVGANRRASSPRVAYNPSSNEYLVVFQANALRGEGGTDAYEIFGQRINAATLAESGPNDFRISTTTGAGNRANRPSVSFNTASKEYLIIWRSSRQNGTSEIYGQRLDAAALEIETNFQISNIAHVGTDRTVNNSTLTQNTENGEYFVVWQGNGVAGPNAANTEVFGQRLALAR